MEADAQVIISTKLDTKELETQLKDEQKQLEKYQKEAEKLTTTKVEIKSNADEMSREFDNLTEKLQKYADKIRELEKEKAKIGDPNRFNKDAFYQYNGEIKSGTAMRSLFEGKISDIDAQIKQIESDAQPIIALQEKVGNNLNKENEKLREINAQLQQNAQNQSMVTTQVESTQNQLNRTRGFDSIKKSLNDIGKHTEKNIKKVGKWALAIFGIRAMYMMVRNAINTISQDDKQLKADIDYIKSIFAYSLEPAIRKIVEWAKLLLQYLGYIVYQWTGKDIFAGANKHLKNANKQAKELKKQLAGFDEVNVMSDNKTSDSGATPSLKPLEDREAPAWLRFIVDHKDEILSVLAGIATGLLLVKFGVDAVIATGIGLMVAGVILAVQGLLDYLKDPTWENFGKVIEGIGLFVIGLGVAFLGLPAIITGVFVLIFGIVAKYWDKIHDFLQGGIDWLTGQSDWVHEHFGDVIGGIYDTIVGVLQNILDYWDTIFTSVKRIFDGLIQFITSVFKGDWKGAWEGIKKIFVGVFDIMFATVNLIFNNIKTVVVNVAKTIGDIFVKVFNGIVDTIKKIGSVIGNIFGAIGQGAKNVVNVLIDGINWFVKQINKIGFDVPDWVPVIGGKRWGFNLPELPRLAQGGIVNMPGKGVMMGNYVAGERGREAVLPLTDPSAMSALGQEIARYCNINNAVELNVDSRRLGRVLQQSQNASDFARNM